MGLFSKLKDYNSELEKILDNKYFSSSIKSLLFSMIYKLEISYVDFKEVKRCVRSKEDFLNEIIEIIRLYCDNIKTVEPDSNQAKMLIDNNVIALTNEKERSILAYPTENAFLYAISDISPKYFYINSNFMFKEIFQNSLVNGYNLNNIEILRDFSGWSWDEIHEKNFNFIDNLIYQNLLVILGEKFLYEWRIYGSTRRDFLKECKNYIKIFTGNDKYLKALYKALYYSTSGKVKEELKTKIKLNLKKLKDMQDKEKFFANLNLKKEKIEKKLKKIDLILDNSKLLEKEFSKIYLNKNNNIKNLRQYRKMLENEREKNFYEVTNIIDLLKPTNFLAEKQNLELASQIYKSKENLEEVLIDFQKEFIYFLGKKLNKMKNRDEIVDIVYEIRYYKNLYINENTKISDIEILDNMLDKVLKKAVTMLCKLGALKIISMDINLNYEIIKYALSTRIINLEEIKLYFDEDKQGLIIKVYDKDVFEKQGRKRIKVSNETLEVRKKRKIKLFN